MCCCEKPVVNGEIGYKWSHKDAESIHPISAPEVAPGEIIRFDEPGRCGGQDSHSFHYRVVTGGLLVRHGAGDERIRLSNAGAVVPALASLDSNARYWLLNAIFHAHSDGKRTATDAVNAQWRKAAAEKRIRTRTVRGSDSIRVWIEPDKSISRKAEREPVPAESRRLIAALVNLAAYANGKLGRNPYGIPEYEEALRAIGEAIGYTGDWMDTLDKVKGRL